MSRFTWSATGQLALLLALATSPWASGDDALMRLRLKDSSLTVGRVVPTTTPHAVGWLSEGFEQPFDFDARAIRSISTIDEGAGAANQTGQSFELADGGMIKGQLLGMDEQWVTIESPILGKVRVERTRVVSMIDAGYAGELIYAGPRDDKTWRPGQQVGDQPNWEFEAGTLVAKRQGASIVGNVKLPKKAQVHLVLSWKGAPDFVFSFATDPTKEATAITLVPAAARLEVWDKQLALLREVDKSADIELLAELSPSSPRLELTVYLDQDAGLVVVCDSHGKPLDRMLLPAEKPIYETGVQLVNHGTSLTLERFEVREWDGLTTLGGSGSGIIMNDAEAPLDGNIVGFDATAKTLQVQSASGIQSIPLESVRRGDFGKATPVNRDAPARPLPPPVAQPPQLGAREADAAVNRQQERDQGAVPADGADAADAKPEAPAEQKSIAAVAGLFEALDDTTPTVDPPSTPIMMEVVWKDRTRLTGEWLTSEEGRLKFHPQGFEQPLFFDADDLIGLVGNDERFAVDLTQQKNGTLKVDDILLAGFLEPNATGESGTSLAWHPHGSLNAAMISAETSGAIVYRASLPRRTTKLEENPGPRQDAIAGPVVQLFLGGNRATTRNNTQNTNRSTGNSDERELVFRSGDSIKGVVKRMDESGVLFESPETSTTFASHDQMQSVWLNRKRREYEIAPEKLERLMTVPRAMKFDPPTHLFVSIMGDYLRGRLISVDEESLAVEVRSEIVQLPREQVAQVIWLHDRDWSNDKKSDEKEVADEQAEQESQAANEQAADPNGQIFRVHAIKANDRGLTFAPTSIENGVLRGSSDLLGDCAVEISELNQILFGKDISQQVRAFREDPWTLSLAPYPNVYDADGGPSAEVGANSPLVGKPAPDFGLKNLNGERFLLSESHDRVLVLDFWASWCGPCVQTMPLVEEAVKEVGEDKVHLVAVNIQETPERVKAAVERLKLDATVLLDRDGEVAAAYGANAIPQTVIIDKEGNVTHVFVGGGARIVEAIRSAIE